MTLLSIVQNVAAEIGLAQPSSVINNTDSGVRQLLAIVNRSGKLHAKNYGFEALTREGSFTTSATESQGLLTTIASGFDRFISQTMYDRSNTWQVFGPVTEAEWQMRKNSQLASGVRNVFRIRGGYVIFNPLPSAGRTVYFEYKTKDWAENSLGVGKASMTVDTDVSRIDEVLIELDVKWRWLKSKGLNYAEEFRDWQLYLTQLLGFDGGNDVLDMAGEKVMSIEPAIPDGSWPLT